MQRLKPGEHVHLTDSLIKTLAQNRITTILDFLQEDIDKLLTLTKLTLPQVLDVRNDILQRYSASCLPGTTFMLNNTIQRRFISTGIECLDAAINGGIPVAHLTEVCGLADSGKTQLCLQLAINVTKDSDNAVLYVDTKGDFSATKIQKVLDACGYSFKEMAQMMVRIKVVHAWTMDEILLLFKNLKDKSVSINNLRLIIIDSLPCLMFQFLGDQNKVGLTFLNTLVNYSRYLSKEMKIGIVCVNIQTRWVDQDILDVDDDGEQSVSKEYTEKRNRCLGKYWHQIPALVLTLEKSEDKEVKINITVSKSLSSMCNKNKCVVRISKFGVT